MLTFVGQTLSSAAAFAQEPGRWEATVFAGYFLGSRTFTSESVNVLMATVPTYGLRLGVGISRAFSLEAGWSRAASRLEPFDPATGESLGPSAPVLVNTYEIDVLYWFGRGKVRGDLGLGGGVMHLNPSVATLDRASSAQFAANFALGGTFSLSSRVALRADARYRWRGGRTRVGDIVCYPYACEPFTTNIFSSAEVSGGVMVRF